MHLSLVDVLFWSHQVRYACVRVRARARLCLRVRAYSPGEWGCLCVQAGSVPVCDTVQIKT